MTDATRTIAYLKQALAIDPYTRTARIISLRERFHRRAPRTKVGTTQDGDSFRERHSAAQTCLDRARVEFWKLPDDALNKLLASIDLRAFPHLANSVERLKTVAPHRAAFRIHARQTEAERQLIKLLRTVLVGEPHEIAAARKELEDKARWTTAREKIAIWLGKLKTDAPAVFALEAEWFGNLRRGRVSADTRVDRIIRQSATTGDPEVTDKKKSGSSIGVVTIVVIVAINVVRILVTHSHKESPSSAPPVVRPATPIPTASPLEVSTVPPAPARSLAVPARPDDLTRNEAIEKAMERVRKITDKKLRDLGTDSVNRGPYPGQSLGIPPIPPVPQPHRTGPPPGPP